MLVHDRPMVHRDDGFWSRWAVGTSLAMIERYYAPIDSDLDHQETPPKENTIILESYSLDYLMGRVSADPERPLGMLKKINIAAEKERKRVEAELKY